MDTFGIICRNIITTKYAFSGLEIYSTIFRGMKLWKVNFDVMISFDAKPSPGFFWNILNSLFD